VSIHSRSQKIIVNADDFGMSAEANRAIVEAFEKKLISSTTVMANMSGFDEACELAHRHGLVGKVGVHLNLTSGYPLSEPIRQCARFCDDSGKFQARQTRFWLSKKERLATEMEIEAQIQACLDRELCPTHVDSHHHVHTEWPIGTIVIAAARRYGIKAIRLSRNCGPGIDLIHRFYKWTYNTRLKAYGLAKSQYFGSVDDVQDILANASGDVEVMVHLTSEYDTTCADRSGQVGLGRWFATYQLASYS
jgi:chitin disaccharide deacetylase